MKEVFRDIEGYKGFYQVSNLGRVGSLNRYVKCKGNSKRLVKGRILRFSKSIRGYKYVILCKESVCKTYTIHRLVLIMFDRISKGNEECNHKNGIKTDNCIKNLEWCTHRQNCNHRDNILGKHNRGENNRYSKLVDNKVREIKDLLKRRELTQKQIGRRYNVSQSVVSLIKTNKGWGHIK